MVKLPTTSGEECQRILQQRDITVEDRFKLQRMNFRSLAGEYSDLSSYEIGEVNDLEERNLYKVINATAMLLGFFGEDLQDKLLSKRFFVRLYSMDRDSDVSEEDFERARFQMAVGHMLSEFSDNPKAWPKFDGKIPSRPFKFRQVTAESWYKDIVGLLLLVTGTIYAKSGAEEAFCYVTAIIAHHLAEVQPDRYPVSSYLNENDAIHGILVKYIQRMGGNSSIIR